MKANMGPFGGWIQGSSKISRLRAKKRQQQKASRKLNQKIKRTRSRKW